jgi:enterochelin esterase family protein
MPIGKTLATGPRSSLAGLALGLLVQQPVADPAPPESPRIARLASELATEGPQALERFWSELQADSTPIFEPSGDPGHTLVTFVWRGDADTRNVVVVFDAETSIQRAQLVRLADTDVWYRSYRLPSEAQFYYQMAPNDTLVPFDEETDWSSRDKTFTADPLNPRGIVIGDTRHFSFAVLPGAPRIAAYDERPDVPKGRFEPGGRGAFQIESALGKHRVWIYATPGPAPAESPTNLVLFLDGSGAWQLLPSVRMFDNLFHDGSIGATIAVYTDCPDRDRDLACSDEYLAFLIDELIPWVQERHAVEFTAERTVISGRSLGGLFAGYACLRRPDVFGQGMLQSPSLWWGAARDGENEWLTREFAGLDRVDARFFVAPGRFETASNSPTSISILFSSRHFRDVLRAKGYSVVYREVTGGHDPLNWEVSLPEAIELFLGTGK